MSGIPTFCNRWFGLDRGFLHYEDVAVCLVEILRSSDMGRSLISKVAPSIFTRDRPYAYFNRKDAATVNHDMLSWLDSQPKGRPFFAFLNYFDAHDPYITAEGAPRHFGLRPETGEEIAALRDWLHVDKSKVPEPAAPDGDRRLRRRDRLPGRSTRPALRRARFERATREHADRRSRPTMASCTVSTTTSAMARTSIARSSMFRS